MAMLDTWEWEDPLAEVLLTKSAKVVLEASQVLEEMHQVLERTGQHVKQLKSGLSQHDGGSRKFIYPDCFDCYATPPLVNKGYSLMN